MSKRAIKDYAFTGVSLASALLIILFILSRLSLDTPRIIEENQDHRILPVIAYSKVYPEASYSDGAITPSMLEGDLVFLEEKGFETVTTEQISAYLNGKGKLPEKPVLIVFDEGSYSVKEFALPILKKHNAKAAITVVGKNIEIACEDAEPISRLSYLDFNDLSYLLQSGLIELVSKSYELNEINEERTGLLQNVIESFSDYRRMLLNDTFAMQRMFKERLNYSSQAFSYPFGLSCAASKAILKLSGYNIALAYGEKINHLTYASNSDFTELYCFERKADETTPQFMMRIMEN
ncbi:MAG: polysaccharide deacetylase family protein [Ruminococcus sp.]|nr:polysaccharide deacetylase family protein [Ruminococcus sp.]